MLYKLDLAKLILSFTLIPSAESSNQLNSFEITFAKEKSECIELFSIPNV